MARLLREHGHDMCTPTLTELGGRSHLLHPDTHITDVMNVLRLEGRFWEIDTGHDLMITEPEAVATVLEEIAACSSNS